MERGSWRKARMWRSHPQHGGRLPTRRSCFRTNEFTYPARGRRANLLARRCREPQHPVGGWRRCWSGKNLHAAWSPSESHLAFVRSCRPHAICPDHALYLAEGDGTELQRVTTLDGYGRAIDWSPDGLWVFLQTKTSLYELNVTTGRLQITQLPTATAFPTSTVENGLSDSDK